MRRRWELANRSDWEAWREAWIHDVETQLMPRLQADVRLVGSAALIGRFHHSVARWRRAGGDFRQVINDANELAAAAALRRRLGEGAKLIYELPLAATNRTMDFHIDAEQGRRWVDMKTVAPKWKDDAESRERLAFYLRGTPPQAKLALDKDFVGGGIGGHLISARFTFVKRAIVLEGKLRLLTDAERAPTWLLLCSDGTWRLDDLEDFADFYHSGRFRPDDWSRAALAGYMEHERLNFERTIAGFCYLERRHEAVEARRFEIDVRGPAFMGVGARGELRSGAG